MRPNLSVYLEDDEEVLVVTEEPLKSRPRPKREQYGVLPIPRTYDEPSPPTYQGPGPHGDVLFRLHNDGKTTATNVRGWLRFEAARLKPIDSDDLEFRSRYSRTSAVAASGLSFEGALEGGFYEVTLHESSLSPGEHVTYEIPAVFRASGPTRIEYSVVCNEGSSAEGVLEARVPSFEERSRRLQVGTSGLSDEELRDLSERVWTIFSEEWEHSEDSQLYGVDSAVVNERLATEGVKVPDYALHEALELLLQEQNHRLKTRPYPRASEEDIRKHGGVVMEVVET
jgi:hypothetical protein